MQANGPISIVGLSGLYEWTLDHVRSFWPWVLLFAGWGVATFAGLTLLEIIYGPAYDGRLFGKQILRPAEYPLDYYLAAVWQLTTALLLLGAIVICAIQALRVHKPGYLLAVLLAGDAVFTTLSYIVGGKLAINRDGGVPELYQDLKFLLAAGACLWIWQMRRSSRVMGVFACFFVFLFIDEAFKFHELLGAYLHNALNLDQHNTLFGATIADPGELLAVGFVAAIFLPYFLWKYLAGDAFGRRLTHRIAMFVTGLAFFGLVIDNFGRKLLGTSDLTLVSHIEECGEMIVMSLLAAYLVSVAWSVLPRPLDEPQEQIASERS